MEIAFLTDPLDTFKIGKDSTFAIMQAAAAREHTLYAFEQPDISLSDEKVTAQVRQISLTGSETADWYRVENTLSRELCQFDAVIVRKDPPFDMNYVFSTWLLEIAEWQGARVFNRPRALRDYSEKLSIARFPQFVVPTRVGSDKAMLQEFHAVHHDVIFKPIDGMGGAGVFRIGPDGMNLGATIEMLTREGTTPVMAQRYIPEIRLGDKRILLIAGEVVPYALARTPQAGEVRGNLAAGGIGIAQPLSDRDKQIAQTLAPRLAEEGLFLVGLDVIGDWLTEINVTSPTCFREITQQTGFDVAGLFVTALENTLRPAMSRAH
ncbi:MAG: glutathione synthase [Burkholderiaceae bacterium]|jgi:glutathione synthase|nr:glutathione synthase [Burkholderiaceae bacterium]